MTIEKPKVPNRRKRPAAPTTPDPVEIAMEIAVSGKSPSTAALEVLETNAALMREQIGLSREQIGLARNERFRNRIRSIRDIAIAAMVVALVVAVGAVVWSASRTTGLVIQPFSVPPELVEDGLDGRAVAALFQDELVRLDAVSQSARPSASFRNDWSEGITVEVEAGGLSLTDTYRALVRLLGKESYVDGGLSRTTRGLELVIRTSDGTAVTVQGPADRPADLMRQAAERVYEQTQPYRYSTYLGQRSDALPAGPERQALNDSALAILTTLLDSPSQTERVWAYNGLSRHRDISLRDASPLLQAALEIDPEHPVLLINSQDDARILGHSEASLSYAKRWVASLRSTGNRAKVAEDRQQTYPLSSAARVAELQGDFLQVTELRTRVLNSGFFVAASGSRVGRVEAFIALHQPSTLQRLIDEEDLGARGRSAPGNPHLGLRAGAAADLDQWPQALAFLVTLEAEEALSLIIRKREAVETQIWPRLAYARARTGDLGGAQALIAETPLDCYPCVRERARIAELAGDRAAADRWSAEARRQGPSLPFAFAERGQMLMGRGDIAGAIDFYEQAIERGPRWADPQKYWGDALIAQGDEGGAIRKYRAAADRAPRWGALHLAWGRALEAQGRRDQAREKYTEAARMDLSAADRAEVVRRLGAVSRGS
jgi:tetratricopeptide (TPR) repeat protein